MFPRLVVAELAQDIQVCVLCGPQPSLAELERGVAKCWKPALPHLAQLQVNLKLWMLTS